jgi:hypothetical protein
MSFPEKIKIVADIKTLQVEEKAIQVQNMTRQSKLEPLQEYEEQLVIDIDAVKLSVECITVEGGELLQKLVIAQLMEDMAERSSQAQA